MQRPDRQIWNSYFKNRDTPGANTLSAPARVCVLGSRMENCLKLSPTQRAASQEDLDHLWAIFRKIIKKSPFRTVIFLVDELDECENASRLEFFQSLQSLYQVARVRTSNSSLLAVWTRILEQLWTSFRAPNFVV